MQSGRKARASRGAYGIASETGWRVRRNAALALRPQAPGIGANQADAMAQRSHERWRTSRDRAERAQKARKAPKTKRRSAVAREVTTTRGRWHTSSSDGSAALRVTFTQAPTPSGMSRTLDKTANGARYGYGDHVLNIFWPGRRSVPVFARDGMSGPRDIDAIAIRMRIFSEPDMR